MLNKTKLTCIITFLNEGIYVRNTVNSIRNTANNDVNIILVDDCSTDDYDYESVAVEFDCVYHRNDTRCGVAMSRDIGVGLSSTDYCILLDGHMFFNNDDWHNKITTALTINSNGIYCAKGQVYRTNDTGVVEAESTYTYGANLSVELGSYYTTLEPKHIPRKLIQDNTDTVIEIPCLLGATYFFDKNFYWHIGGLYGLDSYSNDELYLSLKTWLTGGRCYLLTNIVIGHLYRSAHPYSVHMEHYYYNKFLVIRTLSLDTKFSDALFLLCDPTAVAGYNRLGEEYLTKKLDDLEIYYSGIFDHSRLDYFWELNDKYT